MENLQGVHGAEEGSDPEFHDIPTHALNATNSVESTSKVRPELPLLLRVLHEDGRPCQQGVTLREVLHESCHIRESNYG